MSDTAIAPAKRGSSHFLFLLTILMGSFLLFLVQPMIARMALPRLGGAPAVWNSAMLVYQALLLGGYAYAHRLTRAAPKRQAMVHLALLLIAALWLPIGLANFQPPVDGSPIFWVPWLLIASIGPLFFAVAAQAPLMQRWYGYAGNAGEPYALYAASNVGSFAGLIAYPLLVEPFMPLHEQTWLWSGIYVLLILAVAACAWRFWNAPDSDSAVSTAEVEAEAPPISWKRRLYWIALAAVPSGLMLSTTSHLTTDLMAMPLIWVVPLGLYLLSFSVAFADQQYPARIISLAAPIVVLIGGMSIFQIWGAAAINGLAISLGMLFVIAVALHNEMYRSRPAPSRLTEFYLMMSLGGVIGGFFCAIVAPLLFNWTWEHPILIVAAALLLPQRRLFTLGEEEIFSPNGMRILMLSLGLLALAIGFYAGSELPAEPDMAKIACLVAMLAIGVIVMGNRLAFAFAVAGLMVANGGWQNIELSASDARMRSYFGTYTINHSSDNRARWLSHGTTMHGMQLLDAPTVPISYYAPTSGVGLAMGSVPRLYGKDANVGVVGLGTGTLACYRQPGQYWNFFEIDPLMIEIAETRGIFSFVSKCAPNVPVTLGDARLTLADVKPGTYDILAIDAFSSDAIPLHLMTKEAFEVYRRALGPDGLLLVHISNRYIDLNPVVAAQAKAGGWSAALRFDSPPQEMVDRGVRPSQWIAMSQNPEILAKLTGPVADKRPKYYVADQWIKLDPVGKTQLWTDDYASVLPHLSIWKVID